MAPGIVLSDSPAKPRRRALLIASGGHRPASLGIAAEENTARSPSRLRTRKCGHVIEVSLRLGRSLRYCPLPGWRAVPI